MICVSNRLVCFAAASLLGTLASCTTVPLNFGTRVVDVPYGAGFEVYADKSILRAPTDWNQLAHDASFRVLQRASQAKELQQKPIYVSPPVKPTPFESAMYQFLQSGLVELGLTVVQRPEDAVKLEYIVQPVRSAWGMDVLVTTAIGNGFRYIFRQSDVYMVNAKDAALYDASFVVVTPPPQIPVKKLSVTGDGK